MYTAPLRHCVSNGGFRIVRALYVNELPRPTDVKRADEQLHLREFLHSQNIFLSIAVVSRKPIIHHPKVYALVENHLSVDYSN